jgi:hypothetical protein
MRVEAVPAGEIAAVEEGAKPGGWLRGGEEAGGRE